ncbi:MAG: LTA synthase family protein [Bacteroidia bacterium]
MKSRISFYIRLIAFWLLFFVVVKLYFLLVNSQNITDDLLEFPRIVWNGLRLDLSIAGYYSVIPLLLGLFSAYTQKIQRVYWWLVWVFTILVVAVDPYFFMYWGQKTNLAFTQFLGKENAGLSSIDVSTYVVAIGLMVLAIFWFNRKGLECLKSEHNSGWWGNLILLALSVLMIRSGVGKVPINISSAYYSQVNLYNNTAANSIWQFLATELERDKHAPLVFFDDMDEAQAIYLTADSICDTDLRPMIIPSESPNVVFVVLESFSAKTVGSISGPKYASTPELDKIMAEGISYNRAYASSFRSDKGLLALTTGVPSSARQTLTNFPDRLMKMPNVFRLFDDSYNTGFYYGGNLEFANIKVLFNDADYVKSQHNFDSENKNAWGIHDDTVFDRFLNDFLEEEKPQFKMMFSLSSHEPFDVPNYREKEDPYLNSIAYTDSCLGVLVQGLKNSDKWDNTIVFITADHGTIRPDNAPIYDTSNFRIPLVITGGLVRGDTVVQDVVSQTELPATISHVVLGKNLFNQKSILTPSNRAFYSYHNGITYVTPMGVQYYDIGMKKYLYEPFTGPIEKAFYQLSNEQFFND